MVTIESSPEMVAKVYSLLSKNISIIRKRLNRPLTLTDKILLGHLENPEEQELIRGQSQLVLKPDRVALQDVLGQTVMLNFMQTKKSSTAVPTTVHCDHLIQARVEGGIDLLQSVEENDEVYSFLRSACAKFGAGFWEPGAGIIHQVILEQYAFPGCMLIGTDSHTPNAGGLGTCAVGVGRADAVEVMAGLPWELLYPKHIGVKLTGELKGWTAPKDVILYLAGKLTVSGGTNSIIEYFGPGVKSISCTGRATITNMGAELGATTSIFPYDDRMGKYLRATNRSELADLANINIPLITPDDDINQNPLQYFDKVVEIDLSSLEPHLVGPHSPDRARPLSELAKEVSDPANNFIDKIDTALIGSCTNSSYEDMSRAADIANQASKHNAKSNTPLMVTPGSDQVRMTIERDGQMDALKSINATVLANACGPCIGQWKREKVLDDTPNTIITSYNRNFPRRNDGKSGTMNFIASPEIVVALGLAGTLSFNPNTDDIIAPDGTKFRLNPPVKAPEVPPNGFHTSKSKYIAPPEDGSNIEIAINPESQRLESLQPWSAWDGNDYIELPILVKTKGKTTTDHISPAGPWRKYRGHLSKFSENMFMGAVNAFTDETGKGLNVSTGETSCEFSKTASYYRDSGLRWVVIGDENYGEGSSREHAALSPRLLGGAAVIAKSFARIHESNLKKQGLIPLTFQDPQDYDRIMETDRISLTGLKHLTSGSPVDCTIHHSDGTTEYLKLNHSFATGQLEWFKAGSAMNLFHSK